MATAARLPLVADRWTPFVPTLSFVGVDLTGADMRAQVRLRPDAGGSPLVDLPTVTTANTQGLRLLGVTTDGAGVPTSMVALRINETTMEGLPAATEVRDAALLAWDMQITIGGIKQRWLFGDFIVLPGCTGADASLIPTGVYAGTANDVFQGVTDPVRSPSATRRCRCR